MTTPSKEVAAFNDALASLRRAIARGATDIAKLSYYPTLKRRYAALEEARVPYPTRIKATSLIQDCEAELFGEAFTYSLDAARLVRAGEVICWTCGKALPKWQVEFGYKQCEDCQIKAEKQFELDSKEQ